MTLMSKGSRKMKIKGKNKFFAKIIIKIRLIDIKIIKK
jgi:hypothetical protein